MYANREGAGIVHERNLSIVNAVDGPALIVTPTGVVVFANGKARAAFANPVRLADCYSDHGFRSCLRWVPLKMGRERLYLVLPSVADLQEAHATRWARRWKLPPRQAKVAVCIAQGMSDKEVASKLGVTVSTARTYAKRLYANARVHSRSELMRAILNFSREEA
jgi:DNA-binding CsgD family transcriptional regulator